MWCTGVRTLTTPVQTCKHIHVVSELGSCHAPSGGSRIKVLRTSFTAERPREWSGPRGDFLQWIHTNVSDLPYPHFLPMLRHLSPWYCDRSKDVSVRCPQTLVQVLHWFVLDLALCSDRDGHREQIFGECLCLYHGPAD